MNILYIPELLPMPILDAGTINGFEVLYKGMGKNGEKIPFMRLNEELFVELEHDALKLYDESFQRRMGFQFTMMGLFMNLLGKLARSYVTEDSSNDNIYKDMGDVIACLHSRFRQKITLEQLCRIANMSRSSLMRL